ncbi:beta-Ala-His dipeptidase [Peredibacter sp. HCB2-198]|uniref:beta-Ala-His dipeptidase n=1 Tax=Peredibacter sp. HCB2-198 TaxID=3383025 RepID=UPI0038B63D19
MYIPEHFPAEPKALWSLFHTINQLPRPSRKEDKFREFILKEAETLKLKTHTDEVGNVIVYVPATPGYENHETVIIQNHMDMVTDATPDRNINFAQDPIVTFRDGDWIKADRTTLGADNGIGCAAALALMYDKTVSHPPLELLFTIDEETGLKGAWGVDANFLKGKKMLNLDTEEWGSLYIGCAGGIDYEFKKTVKMVPTKLKGKSYKLTVGGFLGGHSGVDIHEQRGNAIKFLMDWITSMPEGSFELSEWRGGKAHNIIPRDAFALVVLKDSKTAEEVAKKVEARWRSFMPENDRSFFTKVEEVEMITEVVDAQDLKLLQGFLVAFPHGAHAYDLASNKELVSLSNNLAISLMVRGQFYLQSSLRFFDRGECVGLENQVQALAHGFGLEFSKNGEYPSWKPVRENKLLDLVADKYQALFQKKAKVTAIHAGLECGILRDKIGPIDAVSFGPTIMGAHSPQERVHIPSVETFWKLFKEVLKAL